MNKNIKWFLYLMLFFGFFALTAALFLVVVKTKNENKELRKQYSSTLAAQTKEIMKKEKILDDRKEAVGLVKGFIPMFFLADNGSYAENREKMKDMVSAELYNRVQDEEFTPSGYTMEIVSAPVYALEDEEQTSRYHYCCILSLQYREGSKDYGIHMQIWDFECGYVDGKMRILSMDQQRFIESTIPLQATGY